MFPRRTIHLLRLGEETAQLRQVALRAAEIHEEATRLGIQGLVALLVPSITILMGAIVAWIVSSLMLAMISLNNLANGHLVWACARGASQVGAGPRPRLHADRNPGRADHPGLVAAIAATREPARSVGLDLRASGSMVADALRLARARAIAADRPVSFVLDLRRHAYSVGGSAPDVLVPEFALSMTTMAGGCAARRRRSASRRTAARAAAGWC